MVYYFLRRLYVTFWRWHDEN